MRAWSPFVDADPGVLISFLGFVLVLGPLVFLHELGHYLVGRWCGVKADVFSIGFGRELVGWTDKRGTRWKLSLLPLGGYVQFAGDMSPTSKPSAEWLALPAAERNRTFQAKALWQRALIVLAGPVTNLLVALVILSGFAMAYGKLVVPPVVGVVQPGSVAEKAGIRVGDRIVALRGGAVDTFLDVKRLVAEHPGEPLGWWWNATASARRCRSSRRSAATPIALAMFRKSASSASARPACNSCASVRSRPWARAPGRCATSSTRWSPVWSRSSPAGAK
jgi:hypothetical protein